MSYSIDTSSPVLVTGATGYIAGVLIKELLEAGVTVHATVRDPSKTDRFQYLIDLAEKSKGSIKFFCGDLLTEGSFAEGMKGCSVVFHMASPFTNEVTDPQKQLVEPAVKGTKIVLNEATNTPTVKKVVLTSSVAAINTQATDAYKAPNNVLNEEVWNMTCSLDYMPYYYSKTMAEKAAWVIAGSQVQWKLVAINPGFVMGPGVKYHESSESFSVARLFVDGTLAYGSPNMSLGIVDVREVAHAHVVAAYSSTAKGRYIISGHNSGTYEMGEVLKEKYPQYPLPPRKLPKFLFWLVSPYFANPLPRKYVWNNADIPPSYDNYKSKKELGIEYRPLKETMNDMLEQMIEAGAVKKL